MSAQDVYSVFGLISSKEKISLIENVNSGNVLETLEKVNSFSEGGVDITRLTQDILEILKDVLIYKKTKGVNELSVLDEEEAEHLADVFEIRKLHEMIGTFLKLQLDFKTASNVKTLFEVALLKLLTYEDVSEPAPLRREVKPVIKETPKVEEVKPAEPIQEKPVVEDAKPEPEKVVETPVMEEKPVVEEPKPEVVAPQPKVEKVEEPQDLTKAPDWLVDDEPETKPVKDSGEKYELDDDMIIKLMVIGDKDLRKQISSRWEELTFYLGHPTLGDLVAVLKDGQPFIATKNVLVLLYDFEKLASKVNIKSNSKQISEILTKMFGREMFVYALSRSESSRLVKAYQNLRQISRLPAPNDININLEELRK